MKKSIRIAFGGIITALSVLIMFVSGVIPATEYAFPLFAGVLLIPVAEEIGSKWAWMVFATVSVLSLILVPKPDPTVTYITLLGYYPLIKGKIERINKKWIAYIIKFLLFNVATAASMLLLAFVFSVPMDDLNAYGKYTIVIFLAIANFFFIVYDICLNKVAYMYLNMFSKHLSKYLKS